MEPRWNYCSGRMQSQPQSYLARWPASLSQRLAQGHLAHVGSNFFKALFGTWRSTATTLVLALLIASASFKLTDWAILSAVWVTPPDDASACRAARGQGACWALLAEKARFILFATYPYDQQWRPATVCVSLIALIALTAVQALWGRRLIFIWVVGLVGIGILMWGGVLGLPFVRQELWGGLPITLVLATFGIAFALPLGILLALGRQASTLPIIKALCIGYIEAIRAVPLVSLLFMTSFVLPIFLPIGTHHRQGPSRTVRASLVFRSLSCGGSAWRAAEHPTRAARGSLRSRPRLLDHAVSDYPSTSRSSEHSGSGQYLDLALQEHIARARGWHLRSACRRQSINRRPPMARICPRDVHRDLAHLFRDVLPDVALQPAPRKEARRASVTKRRHFGL